VTCASTLRKSKLRPPVGLWALANKRNEPPE
jgi:hypothetical protein